MLFALTNNGGRLLNITHCNGYIQTENGDMVSKLKRTVYGTSSPPADQRSYRHLFAPNAKMSPGTYRLVFQAFYQNKEQEQYFVTVYNETVQFVPAPPVPLDTKVFLAVGAGLLLAIIAFFLSGSKGGTAPPKTAAKSKLSDSGRSSQKPANEWLEDTLAGSENQGAKKKKA